MRLGITFGIKKFGITNFDSVNVCTWYFCNSGKCVPVIQKLTESKFGISNFVIPNVIPNLMSAGISCTHVMGMIITHLMGTFIGMPESHNNKKSRACIKKPHGHKCPPMGISLVHAPKHGFTCADCYGGSTGRATSHNRPILLDIPRRLACSLP
jgi:hypothetical protein